MQRAYIDLGIVPHPVRAGTSGDIAPVLSGILGTELDIGFAFMRNNTTEAIAGGTTGGKFTLKKKGDYTGEALLLDIEWTVVGSGAASVYQFTGTLDSDELIAAIVGWLEDEAKKRPLVGLLFSRLAAREVVKIAIRRARAD